MRRAMAVMAGVAAIGLVACGGGTSPSGTSHTAASAGKPPLTVSAAASLKSSFTRFGQEFSAADVRYSFAGSDVLAAQIEQGLKPDVFASANLKLPQQLYAKGLVDKPVTFAANKLVLAVPAGSTKVRSLADAEKPGVTIAIGSPTVPIGSYTRTVLAKLGPSGSGRIMANVRSEESDVSGIVGKLSEGAVDAGFTYVTDVTATKGKLEAIALPASLQPVVAYGAAVVKGTAHPTQARAFIAGLLGGQGRSDLLEAGFLPPPR
ncbi:MAG: molybdate ABC transporter substrate-binding protein [Solirubrobacterales bacterium]|nr:molybdate ABC transporter substrate-binding protein [Solirubrobacterales bacterium]MBV9713896.1 molybdate ABC transporter substrate-binding protein [Solirubrobacterales bacterium]